MVKEDKREIEPRENYQQTSLILLCVSRPIIFAIVSAKVHPTDVQTSSLVVNAPQPRLYEV